ncbi:hypothetical protein XarbCFBP8152_20300 [Xanthomonas arboricola]|nr:hypothetical protein XarbCFBP8152_20300 [Xanthomonas arboricola]
MTSQQTRSNLYHKERRNSSQSGTHLRQTGGFFVPAASCRCNRRDACVGRAANTTPFGEIRPPALCGF